jgi:pterin-4a-carbinolamine dehydratase
MFEARFPYKYLSNDQDKVCITQGIRKSCQQKRSLYSISKNSDNNDKIILQKLLFHFKGSDWRCQKNIFKHLLEISENKIKTMWTIINKVTRKAEKSNHLPHLFKMNNKEVSIEKSAEAFNNFFEPSR